MADVVLKIKPIKASRTTVRSLQRTRSSWQYISGSHTWVPPTDVYETNDAIHVRVEIAGMQDGELSVTLDEDVVLIQGTRPSPKQDCAYHQLEIGYGKFQSGLKLQSPINPEEAQAAYQDGFLVLKLPKVKPHHVEIKER